MSGVVDVAAEVRAAWERVQQAIDLANTVRVEVAEAHERFQAVSRGSGRAEAMVAAARWGQAREHLDRMVGRLLSGGEAAQRYMVALGGGTGSGAGGPVVAGTGVAGPAPREAEPEDRGGRGAKIRRSLTRKIDDIADISHDTAVVSRNLLPHGHGGPVSSQTGTAPLPPDSGPPGMPDLLSGLLAATIFAAEGAARIGTYFRRIWGSHGDRKTS